MVFGTDVNSITDQIERDLNLPFRLEALLGIDNHEQLVRCFAAVASVQEMFKWNWSLLCTHNKHFTFLSSPRKAISR